MYLQKFDVDDSDGKLYWHQYMQNILAAQNEGTTLRKTLANINALDYSYTFIIPVYENMPKETTSRPSIVTTSKLVSTDLVKVNVTNSLKMRNEPNGDTVVGYVYKDEIVTRIEKATKKVNGTYWDKVLKSNGVTGYVARCTYDHESSYKEYLIALGSEDKDVEEDDAKSDSTSTKDNSKDIVEETSKTYEKGDVNMDNKITSSDYVLIKNHIMGTKLLSDEAIKYADYNSDNKITSSDYVLIKNYIMSR